jgi:hypothetical protein
MSPTRPAVPIQSGRRAAAFFQPGSTDRDRDVEGLTQRGAC